jgi:hypothetical protein
MIRLSIYFITCCALIVSSCTIEKRAFRKGYYISWNKPLPKENAQAKEEDPEAKKETAAQSAVSKDTICKKQTEELEVVEIPDTIRATEEGLIEKQAAKRPETRYSETALVERLAEAVESIKEKKFPVEEEPFSEKELNLFALNSFVFAIGYVILIFYAFEHGSLNWPVVLAVTCFFVAVILAIVALVKWKRNRTGFWGTFFALMGLILLAAGSLLFLLYIMSNSSFG